MTRHKTIWFNDENEAVTRFHFDPAVINEDNTTGRWVPTSNLANVNTKRLHREMRDDPMWEYPHMQDIAQTNCWWDYNWKCQPNHHIGGRVILSGIPSQRARLYQVGIPGEAVRLSDSVVTKLLQDDITGNPFVPYKELGSGAVDLYAQLSSTPLHTHWTPDVDPLDTDFSIWFTLRDIYEFPKLAKGLFKGVRRIKSMMNDINRLRILIGRRTLRDIASSHLAVQYGWLPTINGMRDLANIILTWYYGERKHGSKFGRLRTYHGPKRVVAQAKPVVGRRLRFVTAGAGYSHADAAIRVGPLESRLTVKYYFICPELANWTMALKYAVDRLGILDPTAIWDNIPFSFVVDWFIDISRLFHSKKPRLFPVTLVIADWCESISRESQVDIHLDYVGAVSLLDQEHQRNEQLVACRVFERARKRQFPLPIGTDTRSLAGTGLTIRRVINGSAIVVGRTVKVRSGDGGNYRDRI